MLARLFTRQPQPDPPRPEELSILGELRAAHRRLLASMGVVSDIIDCAAPNIGLHAAAMAEFGETKRERAIAIQRCMHLLSESASAGEADRLKELRQKIQRTQRISAEHSRKWTAETIGWNWRGYRLAWSVMRSHWIDLVEAERRLLYPLLSARAQSPDARLG